MIFKTIRFSKRVIVANILGSDSSGSESGSESSSSSSSTKAAKAKHDKLVKAVKKVEVAKKRPEPAEEDDKNIPGDKSSKQKSTRREELLKQLRAVEDAIARKRSKIN